jgi:hypothetical protein
LKGSVKRFKSYRDYKNPRWPPACGRHLGFFENVKIGGISPCGFEVGHQTSKGSVKRFKSYRDYKNPRWTPACGRHLAFLEI